MAALARTFGVMCMVLGGLGVGLAMFNFSASPAAFDEEGGGILLLLTAGVIAASMFLVTVGAIAAVLADIAEAVQQPQAQPRPVERPYGVTA